MLKPAGVGEEFENRWLMISWMERSGRSPTTNSAHLAPRIRGRRLDCHSITAAAYGTRKTLA
jgi:hypothetical protein